MKFVDLFAGLGGFHLALRRLRHNCVFACEIEPLLQQLYKKNFGIMPQGDHDYVFCSPTGGHLHPGHSGLDQLKKLFQKAGLPDIRFHDLRHRAHSDIHLLASTWKMGVKYTSFRCFLVIAV
jgi:site-specific DNA-cytosine methylase